jgi:ATP-dependent RNA helicase SUPV3L1/SUV3
MAAANRVLRGEIAARARRLANDDDEVFALDGSGRLQWRGGSVGRLVAGEAILSPRVEVQAAEFLDGEARERVRQRLQLFVKAEIERRLASLLAMQSLPLEGIARGLVFQLMDALGSVAVADIGTALGGLDRQSRRTLARVGVRFGTESVYLEPLLGAETARFRALLWAVRHGCGVPPVPGVRRHARTIPVDPDLPASFYAAIGRRVVGGWALRADRLERLAAALRQRARSGRFAADAELAATAGIAIDELRRVVTALGYRAVIQGEQEFFIGKPRRRNVPERIRRHIPRDGHPFAKLKELNFA